MELSSKSMPDFGTELCLLDSRNLHLGKIVAALEEIGLDAKVPKSEKEFQSFFLPISATRSLADNIIVKIELHQMHTIGLKMFYEFLSLQGFVRLVAEMVKSAEEQASKQREQA